MTSKVNESVWFKIFDGPGMWPLAQDYMDYLLRRRSSLSDAFGIPVSFTCGVGSRPHSPLRVKDRFDLRLELSLITQETCLVAWFFRGILASPKLWGDDGKKIRSLLREREAFSRAVHTSSHYPVWGMYDPRQRIGWVGFTDSAWEKALPFPEGAYRDDAYLNRLSGILPPKKTRSGRLKKEAIAENKGR